MVFGGTMEAIGALKRISFFLISSAKSIVGLFSSTILSCLTVNITASDQLPLFSYSALKMLIHNIPNRNLSPVNLL